MTIFVNNFFPGVLEPSSIVGGCINIYEQAWPDPENTIAQLEQITYTNTACWYRAETTSYGKNQNHRTNDVVYVTELAQFKNIEECQWIHNQMNVLLLSSTIPYAQQYNITEPLFHESYQALKYDKDTKYDLHYDSGTWMGRIISAVIYLNDDYEGGEIEFPNQQVKIKPEKGMLILFPSNFAFSHIAHPVKEGKKYVLVTWIHDREIHRN